MTGINAYISIFACTCACFSAYGSESADTLDVRGMSLAELKVRTDAMMSEYRFDDALELFRQAADDADSLDAIAIDELMVRAQNGKSMAGFCSSPVPVARQRFSIKDFYLFYPLRDGSWRPVPNQIDKGDGKGFVKATYWPEDTDVLYWSAADSEGIQFPGHGMDGSRTSQRADDFFLGRDISDGVTGRKAAILRIQRPVRNGRI